TLARAIDPSSHDAGSNWWLIAGENSATGNPLIANDPHLALDTPATFYEAHLVVSDQPGCGLTGNPEAKTTIDANGVSFAGVPGLVQGCNQTMCWGSTVNPMDVTDVYQETLVADPETGLPVATLFEGQPEPLILIPQTFLFNQVGDQQPDNLIDAGIGPDQGGVTFVVPRRNHGPIIELLADAEPLSGLSVAYTGWHGTLDLEAFRRFLLAESVDDFRDALQFFDVGSQNWAYADISGNIAYFTSAEMPIREDLQTLGFPAGGVPPFLIRDGTHTLPHEWLPVQNPQPQQSLGFEILPFDEMPQLVNPAQGYIANANNDPIGTTVDNNPLNQVRPGGGVFYLSPGYASLRQGRIDRVLQQLLAQGPVSVADMKNVQANNQLLDAELLSPYLINAFANASQAGAPAELANLAADPGVAEAVTRLMAWDFSSPTGIPGGYDPGDDPSALPAPSSGEIANSIAATIWSVWRGQIVRDVIDGTLTNLGLGDFLPGNRQSYNAVANLLQTFDTGQGTGASGVGFFQGTPTLTAEQQRAEVLLRNLRQALDLLAGPEFDAAFGGSTDQDQYRWGYLHRIVFDHILGDPFSVPSAGGFDDLSPTLPGLARSGGYQAVDASSHSSRADGVNDFMFGSGPARRFVASLDPGDIEAHQILPGGQSGNFADPNYSSQLGRWLTNGYHPLLLDGQAVQDDTVSRLDFAPGCVPTADQACLQGSRFRATVEWNTADGLGGLGWVVPGGSDVSGNFWFFEPENRELLVKVLDGCGFNGYFWVFAAGTTDVGWELTIEDTETGEIFTTSNPLGQASQAVTDTQAFATCP
ncbi:MAG: penicillin acylase family protein, partial [Holophagales bacterium]|nr:penicillin acylase family protein [Holophagales bacterium]